jgi:hypothetical protein
MSGFCLVSCIFLIELMYRNVRENYTHMRPLLESMKKKYFFRQIITDNLRSQWCSKLLHVVLCVYIVLCSYVWKNNPEICKTNIFVIQITYSTLACVTVRFLSVNI